MRIDKTTDHMLFAVNEFSKEYRHYSTAQKHSYAKDVFKNDKARLEAFANGYCTENNLETSDTEEKYALLLDYVERAHEMLYNRFNVEYVSEEFAIVAVMNMNKLLSCVECTSFYKVFGKCSGHLLTDELYYRYAIQEDGLLLFLNNRGEEGDVTMVLSTFGCIPPLTDDIDFPSSVCSLLCAILLLKKFGQVETVLCAGNTRRKVLGSEDVVMNKAPFPITYVDSSWLRTIIRAEGFLVRGHFRLQPCGEKHMYRKLIYIKPFQKHGYTRTARKIVSERRASIAV